MEKLILDSVESCNKFLKTNRYLTNGKNFRVNHLYATAANSRWCYENLWGIYLAKPQFAWMALWIAITSRSQLKKRQVRYFSPKIIRQDFIGRISIFNPQNIGLIDILCKKAYIYLFDPDEFDNFFRLDISNIRASDEKERVLIRNGFQQKVIKRRGRNYNTWMHSLKTPLIVDIDGWQIAVVNVEKIMPRIEVTITKRLIQELAIRIRWLKKEVGENYIVN